MIHYVIVFTRARVNHLEMGWKAKRDKLAKLVKEISDAYGGDNEYFLNDYINGIVKVHYENLDVPIKTFLDVKARMPQCSNSNRPSDSGKITIPSTELQRPFKRS